TLTVSGITADGKVYDGGTVAVIHRGSAALVGVVSGDAVSLDTGSAAGTFSSKTVGTGKTVTVSGLTIGGDDAGNYALTQPTTTADRKTIAQADSGIPAGGKVYEGGTVAVIHSGSAALVGVV